MIVQLLLLIWHALLVALAGVGWVIGIFIGTFAGGIAAGFKRGYTG